MASVTKSPNTCADDATVGTVAWSNPDNAKVSDNIYTVATINNQQTHILRATNFGFTIPSEATITGITVEAEAKTSGYYPIWTLDYVRIIKAGVVKNTNKTLAGYGTTDSYKLTGSSSDLWGETWTYSDINSSDFGVSIRTAADAHENTIYIDHIRITVYYTEQAKVGPFPTFFRQ